MRRTRILGAAAVATAALLAACAADDDGSEGTTTTEPETVTISGVTFPFAGGDLVANAAVGVAEGSVAGTTSDAEGRYTLTVPANSTLTPFVEHPDFVTMHLQTFETTDEDLERVNFQMVDTATYDAFAAVLEIEPDPQRCQIATTVNTIDIRDLSFAEFRAFGPHGVAGATVRSDPSIGDVVYFNEDVIPDRSLTETSVDGGVVWPNVEPGVYELAAEHPDTGFAPFFATCEPGRLVNAGPPWGLRETD